MNLQSNYQHLYDGNKYSMMRKTLPVFAESATNTVECGHNSKLNNWYSQQFMQQLIEGLHLIL